MLMEIKKKNKDEASNWFQIRTTAYLFDVKGKKVIPFSLATRLFFPNMVTYYIHF